MTKAVLEFDLPDESEEFRMATKAGIYYSIITDMDHWLRNATKYGVDPSTDKELPEDHIDIYQKVRDKLTELSYRDEEL